MRHHSLTRAARFAAACLLLTLTAANARAEVFDVQVIAIRGTNANSEISPELKSSESNLKKKFNKSGYQQLKRSNGKATDKKPFVADLVGSFKATVTAIERKDQRLTIDLEITGEMPKPEREEGEKDGEKKGKKDVPDKDKKGGQGKDKDKGEDRKDEKKPGPILKTKLTIDAGTTQYVNVPYPGAPDDLLIIAVSAK